MFMEINNYNSYVASNSVNNNQSSKENKVTTVKNSTDEQTAGKTYSSAREYRTYLTQKYNCLKSSDYSVAINSSLLSEALGDEKTSKWLEYNLALIPEAFDGIKSAVEASGAKLVSCSIRINGYDSMTAEVCTRDEADPGTEKARKELEEKIKKIREEKKDEEKKKEEKRAGETAEKERQYNMRIEGKNVKDVTRQFVDKTSSSNLQLSAGSSNSIFDVLV